MTNFRILFFATALMVVSSLGIQSAAGEDAVAVDAVAVEDAKKETAKTAKVVETKLAGGLFTAKVPAAWKQKPQRSRIIEREFAIDPVKGDENGGRLTMMASGGSVDMNVKRWYGQFKQPDGSSTEKVAKLTDKKVGELQVKIVDIPGNFAESIGPPIRQKTVDRIDYRMLGAIVQSKQLKGRMYFFKLYGPKKTMAAAEKPFMAMIESLATAKKGAL